jgi:drug/metabolite transporter (DMT)-like permease
MGVATGIAQTLTSLVPVLIIPFVIFVKRERVTWRAAVGATVAVAGVAMLLLGTV